MRRRLQYLTQPPIELPCCQLLAGLNAMRYMGIKSPEPGDPHFDELVDIADCRTDGATNIMEAWGKLGLFAERGPHELNWITSRIDNGMPTTIIGQFGEHTHMGLGIAVRKAYLYIVNWDSSGPISRVKFDQIVVPKDYAEYSYALSYPNVSAVW